MSTLDFPSPKLISLKATQSPLKIYPKFPADPLASCVNRLLSDGTLCSSQSSNCMVPSFTTYPIFSAMPPNGVVSAVGEPEYPPRVIVLPKGPITATLFVLSSGSILLSFFSKTIASCAALYAN